MTIFLKSTTVALALFAGSLIAPTAVSAQTLTVDVDAIYKDSLGGKSGNTQLETKFGARLKAAQEKLQSSANNWNTQLEAAKKVAKPDGTVPPATETALGQAREALTVSQNEFNALRQEIQYADQYIKYQILDKLVPITEKIRKDRKGNLVVPRASVLAYDPAFDITPTALQQVNAILTTVSITPPQQNAAAPAPAAGTAPAQPAKTTPPTR